MIKKHLLAIIVCSSCATVNNAGASASALAIAKMNANSYKVAYLRAYHIGREARNAAIERNENPTEILMRKQLEYSSKLGRMDSKPCIDALQDLLDGKGNKFQL